MNNNNCINQYLFTRARRLFVNSYDAAAIIDQISITTTWQHRKWVRAQDKDGILPSLFGGKGKMNPSIIL